MFRYILQLGVKGMGVFVVFIFIFIIFFLRFANWQFLENFVGLASQFGAKLDVGLYRNPDAGLELTAKYFKAPAFKVGDTNLDDYIAQVVKKRKSTYLRPNTTENTYPN